MSVYVACADLDRSHLRMQPLEYLREARIRAAVVRDLHRLDRPQGERQDRLRLRVGGQPQVEAALAHDRRDAVGVRVVWRGRSRGARRWAEDADREPAD